VKYAFLDEAAHSGFLDDEKVLSATTSRLANTGGYLRTVSTPKGRRGFFYRMAMDGLSGKTRTKVMMLPYTLAVGNLIEEEFIEAERLRLRLQFEQEYECRFLSNENVALESELVDGAVGEYDLK
jgi:hypothetical protein